jgi:hypothetical protein
MVKLQLAASCTEAPIGPAEGVAVRVLQDGSFTCTSWTGLGLPVPKVLLAWTMNPRRSGVSGATTVQVLDVGEHPDASANQV